MKNVYLAVITLLLSLGTLSAKDEILLKEGKTISGNIVHEDADEVTIDTFPNMSVRVEKSKIKEIKRAPKASRGNVWTPPNETSTVPVAGKPAVDKSTAPAKATPPAVQPKPVILSFKPQVMIESRKEGGISVQEGLVHKLYKVKGAQF